MILHYYLNPEKSFSTTRAVQDDSEDEDDNSDETNGDGGGKYDPVEIKAPKVVNLLAIMLFITFSNCIFLSRFSLLLVTSSYLLKIY